MSIIYSLFHRNHEVWNVITYLHFNLNIISYSQKTSKIENHIIHLDTGIHHICLLREIVNLQLQHFVFCDGSYFISAFSILIQRICSCIIIGCRLPAVLCQSQLMKFHSCRGCNEFLCFGVSFLGL